MVGTVTQATTRVTGSFSSWPTCYNEDILYNFYALHNTVHSTESDILELEEEDFSTLEGKEAVVFSHV